MAEVFAPGPYYKEELLSLFKYASVYFIGDLLFCCIGPTVWFFGGLFLVFLVGLNIMVDMRDIADSEKSYGYAIQERAARKDAIFYGLGVCLFFLFIFAVFPLTFKEGQLETVRGNSTDMPYVVFRGFSNPVYDSDGRFVPGITVAKLAVHFVVDLTKFSLLRYVATKMELVYLLVIQSKRKLI